MSLRLTKKNASTKPFCPSPLWMRWYLFVFSPATVANYLCVIQTPHVTMITHLYMAPTLNVNDFFFFFFFTFFLSDTIIALIGYLLPWPPSNLWRLPSSLNTNRRWAEAMWDIKVNIKRDIYCGHRFLCLWRSRNSKTVQEQKT